MDVWYNWRLEQLSQEDMRLILGLATVLGPLYCFLGYRLLKLVIGLTGYLLAGLVAALLAAWISQGNLVWMVVAFLFGGLCGAMAFFFAYRAGIFSLGFLGALIVASHTLYGRPEPWIPYAVIGVGAAGGLLALGLERPTMTLATAVIGAWLMTSSLAYFIWDTALFGNIEPEIPLALAGVSMTRGHWALLGCWLLLTVLGTMTQLSAYKRSPKKES